MKKSVLFYRAAVAAAIFSFTGGSSWAALPDLLLPQGYVEGKVFREGGGDADFIKVEINGHPFTLLIDTGAFVTTISRKAAQKAGLLAGRDIGEVHGANGKADSHGNLAQVSSFRIAGVELAPSPVLIVNMHSVDKDGIDYDGVLGLATMKINHVFFAYDPAFFFFQPHGRTVGGVDALLLGNGFARVSLILRKAGYFVPVSFNETTATLLLDSGATATMISQGLSDRAQLLVDTMDRVFNSGIDGHDVVSFVVLPKKIAIGPLRLPTIPIVAENEAGFQAKGFSWYGDGLLGFDLVGRLCPLLDTTHDWLYLLPDRR